MSTEEKNMSTSQTVQCAQGCGFYGNPMTENMCSKCYKDVVGRREKEMGDVSALPSVITSMETESVTPTKDSPPLLPSTGEALSSDLVQPLTATTPTPVKKGRCHTCKKKLGLLGFTCRCEFAFCSEHRYAESHDCQYDYMTEQRQQLRQANPTVQAEKFNRI